jgi:hypothetical protein
LGGFLGIYHIRGSKSETKKYKGKIKVTSKSEREKATFQIKRKTKEDLGVDVKNNDNAITRHGGKFIKNN